MGTPQDRDRIEYLPVTRERWPDMQKLFEASADEELGNPSRCWCMEMRLRDRAQDLEPGGEGNRKAMEALVQSGETPGILAYEGAKPVGWCSVSPREQLVGLPDEYRSQAAGTPSVWSIACFYVPETERRKGLMKGLLSAAVQYAIRAGAQIVEGYAMTPEFFGDGASGSVPIFEAAGFVEVASVNPIQRVMCYVVER
jgi:GNAT superfamily N-acetyltransferase